MITEIGIAAGDIWQYLDKNGKSNLKELTKATGADQELILMSLGWLAREGHITLRKAAGKYEASLVSKNTSA